MLLGDLQRWGGDDAEIQALLSHADRALEWIERYGDADGDGFVEYSRKTSSGLINQGWKDSWDGINFADGRIAEPPYRPSRGAGLHLCGIPGQSQARGGGRGPGGRRLRNSRADRLKKAFNDAYWMADRGWFAVALDRAKRPVDSLTSNIGHCLWTGIADPGKAALIAEHLLSGDIVQRLGNPDAGRVHDRLQPHELPQRIGMAA